MQPPLTCSLKVGILAQVAIAHPTATPQPAPATTHTALFATPSRCAEWHNKELTIPRGSVNGQTKKSKMKPPRIEPNSLCIKVASFHSQLRNEYTRQPAPAQARLL